MNSRGLEMSLSPDAHLVVLRSAIVPIAVEHRGLHEKPAAETALDVDSPIADRQKLRRRNRQTQPLEERAELLAHAGRLQQRARVEAVLGAPVRFLGERDALVRIESISNRRNGLTC